MTSSEYREYLILLVTLKTTALFVGLALMFAIVDRLLEYREEQDKKKQAEQAERIRQLRKKKEDPSE